MKRMITAALSLLFLMGPAPAMAEGSWEWVGNIDGVKTWRKEVKGKDTVAFKGEVFANVHIGKILKVFIDGKHRRHWVDRYDDHKTFKKQALLEDYWISFDLPWPVSNRDYVLRSTGVANADDAVFICDIKSIKLDQAPEHDCCVRAEAYGTYYKFEAFRGKQRTKLTVEVHTDPKGILPTWLVNSIQKKWPSKTLNGLIKHARKVNQIAEAYSTWHDELPPPPPPAPPAAEPTVEPAAAPAAAP